MASGVAEVEVDVYLDSAADGEEVEDVEVGTDEESESEEEEEEEDEEEDNDGHYVAAGAAEDGEEEEYTEVGTDEEFESEEEEEEEDEEEDNDGHYVAAGAVPVQSGAVDANAQPPIAVLEDDGHVLVEAPGHSAGRASQSVEGEALGAAEGAEDERRPASCGEGEGQEDAGESIDTDIDMSLPHCPICMERWTCQGVHRVCCIPCGHVYGRSCLQTWVRRCGNNFAKCPQCKKRFKMKDIINLYAPQITVVNDDLEKEVNILREKNEILSMERKRLLEEVRKLKEDDMGEQDIRKLKKQCLHQVLSGATDMGLKLLSDSHIHDGLATSERSYIPEQSEFQAPPPEWQSFLSQKFQQLTMHIDGRFQQMTMHFDGQYRSMDERLSRFEAHQQSMEERLHSLDHAFYTQFPRPHPPSSPQ